MSTLLQQGQATQPIQVGDIVENFNAIVRVDRIDSDRGLLVTIIDGGGKGSRYYANPAFCRLVSGSNPIWKHKQGLVCLA